MKKGVVIVVLSTIIIEAALAAFASLGFSQQEAFACQTNSQGCIANNGPGQSFLAPAEVSGCHVFPPVPDCATLSTPPGMGAGPK